MNSNRRILCVGVVCRDLVITTDGFKSEDSMNLCSNIERRSGGNATNDCKIMSQLGMSCEFLGTLASGTGGQGNSTEFLLNEYRKRGIFYENCVFHDNCVGLSSVIILNTQNASRTIYHHLGNLPGLKFADFSSLNLSNYKWIHFESRNTKEVVLMMKAIAAWNADHNPEEIVKVSTEVEYPYDDYLAFFPLVDLLFISKDVAKLNGCTTKEAAAKYFASLMKPGGVAVCPWGEFGAAACVQADDVAGDSPLVVSPSFPPSKLVDTLGCGDTFDSGLIHALADGQTLEVALRFGCRLAGYKCGISGLTLDLDVCEQLYQQTLQEIQSA